MRKLLFAALVAAPIAIALSSPAAAQNYPLDYGDFSDVTGIDILDGGGVEYANYLATEWRKNQEFAKSKGWISDYKVYSNLYPREGEPDLYLMVTYTSMPDAAESMRRDEAYREFTKKNDTQMSAESGNRGKFRKIMSTSLLGELKFKK
ncbi:MAG: hypothetical protein ABI668_07555 [Sphingorhabdus sp.]